MIFVKILVIFKSVCFNGARVITQLTPKCVENCSDNQLCIFVCVTIISVSVTSIITLKQ